MALKEPFPSSPQRPGRYCIRSTRNGALLVMSFAEKYSAKKWLEGLIDDQEVFVKDNTVKVKSEPEIVIWGEFLWEVMEYKYTKEEAEWELPQPYPGYLRQFLGGLYHDSSKDVHTGEDGAVIPASKSKAEKKSRTKKPTFPEEAKIKVLVDKNPKKPGSTAAARFDHYKTGMTVGEALAAGLTLKDLVWDKDHKFVEIGE